MNLRKKINLEKDDSQKVRTLNFLSDTLILENDFENALLIAKDANAVSEKIHYLDGEGESHLRIGIAYKMLAGSDSALYHYNIESENNRHLISGPCI